MIKRLICKLTGGHRFQGCPDTFIDKDEIVHYRHTCIKCGKMCEYCVPWINVYRVGGRVDFSKEDSND